jgi:hypothetical protein
MNMAAEAGRNVMKKTVMTLAGAALLALAAAAAPAAAQSTSTNPLKKPATTAAPAAPAPAAAAPAAAAPAEAKKPPSEAQKAQQAKMKSCAAEWQGMKKAGKTAGMTYRQFSTECLKRG